jgi:hypothetical protein
LLKASISMRAIAVLLRDSGEWTSSVALKGAAC